MQISKAKQFGALVQIQTVIISALPYLIGCLTAYYNYHHFNLAASLLLFVAVVLFHLAVNGHNQYTDYSRYQKHHVKSTNNILVRFKIDRHWARNVIAILTLISLLIGLYLSYETSWLVLVIGVISYLIGFCYSGGPHPILKTPFGEPASGITMGYNITLLGFFINTYNVMSLNAIFWWQTIVIAVPAIFVIASVMLANNICDVDEDVKIERKTLPYYIGRKAALGVLIFFQIMPFVMIPVGIWLKFLPIWTLGIFLVSPLVYKNVRTFVRHPKKTTTFTGILINVLLVLVAEIILLIIGNLI